MNSSAEPRPHALHRRRSTGIPAAEWAVFMADEAPAPAYDDRDTIDTRSEEERDLGTHERREQVRA